MKYYVKKIVAAFFQSALLLAAATAAYAAETVCNDNGGAGWPITDGGITNLSIPFNFGDVSVIHDLDVSTNITHTWIGDLTAKVTSPDLGTQITLFERPGTAAPDSAPASVGPWGCNQNNIVVTFDDEAAAGTNIENLCPPATNGTYLSHDAAPNNLSAFDGEDPSGNWTFYLSDSANGDTGTLNQACISAAFAAVSFDKWVSTNNTCSDTLDTLSVAPGTDVYFCYSAANPSTETFTINTGDATDSQGHDISVLETTYIQNASQTVVDGPLVAGTDLPVGTTVNNAQVTASFATANYTGTLVTGESASVTVGDPVFTTSSKTVVDLNGGAVQAGDTLEYTVSINETAGIYTPNVQLTDVVDANLNSITFTALPVGSTNNTVGNNIDITGLTLPANGTETIVFEVTIGGSVATGTSIDNTAVINHAASGVSYNAVAPTVVVSNNPPASGVKHLYFDTLNATPNLTRVPPGGNTQTGNIDTLTVNQGIVFQAPFTITGGSTVNVQLRMRRRNANTARTIQAQLVNGGTGAVIGTNSVPLNVNNWQTVTVPINIASDANFAAGDYVRVIVDNVPASNGNIQVATLRNGIRSEVQIQTSTVINVDTIGVYAAAYPATTQYSSYEPGSTVYVRAVVSDPFGSADINSANITITDSSPGVRVNNAAMIVAAPSPTGGTRIFEYAYVIPATPDGFWNISITANEGTEGTISHTAQATMTVGLPDITISKNSLVLSDPINVSNPKALPGAIVEYTVAVENAGFGYVDAGTTVITDPLDTGTTYYFGSPLNPATFIEGTTSSGLSFTFTSLASTTDDIDFSNDGGATFVTPTVDASGFDTTSPPINFIRINPKGEFNGSDGANNPSMEMTFRVRLE